VVVFTGLLPGCVRSRPGASALRPAILRILLPGLADLPLGFEQHRELGLAVLVGSQCGLQAEFRLRQQLGLHQCLGAPRGLQPGQVDGEVTEQLLRQALGAGPRGGHHGLGLALLAAAGFLLQRDVHLHHHAPGRDARAHLRRRHPDGQVRVAVALREVTVLLRCGHARQLGLDQRVAGTGALGQRRRRQPSPQAASGAARGDRPAAQRCRGPAAH
jgi:hypothetical protein